ncbi:MAG: chemotaxis protein CheW [Oculatellaceae cyanobacterium Prado106]|jgi:chemotaxis-related protein WspD|nr:chemotaxis protein CheW [Oculatellaceae cyanobacterium Prado106]
MLSESSPTPAPTLDRCWPEIGIWGDRTCPELQVAIHCRNCPVYTQAGRSLLKREVAESVLLEWNQAQEFNALQGQSRGDRTTFSAMVFRLATEWFALSTAVFQEVTHPSTVRKIPHRTNQILQGVVNVRGELQLCVSLTDLLNLQIDSGNSDKSLTNPRFLVIEQERDRWVFPVDEVDGIHHFSQDQLEVSPAAIAQTAEAYTKGVLNWQGRSISVLDEALLFYRLQHKVLR